MEKEMIKDLIFSPITFIIVMLVIVAVITCVAVNSSVCSSKGYITDKFILPDNGFSAHYFVLDNKTEVKIDTNTYYKYDIGDYFKLCDG